MMPTGQRYGVHGLWPCCCPYQHGLVLYRPRTGPLHHAVQRGPGQEEVDLLCGGPL